MKLVILVKLKDPRTHLHKRWLAVTGKVHVKDSEGQCWEVDWADVLAIKKIGTD